MKHARCRQVWNANPLPFRLFARRIKMICQASTTPDCQRHPRHQAAGGHPERLGMALAGARRPRGSGPFVCAVEMVAIPAGECSRGAADPGACARETKAPGSARPPRRSRNRFASWFPTPSGPTSRNNLISARRNAPPRNFCTSCRPRICCRRNKRKALASFWRVATW